ncbi:hypothetical protein ACNOYE_09230 [Nannocystaceae bacterium ST9]
MRRPESFAAAQVEPMRAVGHDRIAIEDAVAVGAMFACITRVADSLGFTYPNAASREMTARRLLGAGYGAPPVERHGSRRFAGAWAAMQEAVETTPGHADPELRKQVFAWIERDARTGDAPLAELPSELHVLLRKGSRNAFTITDEDIAALRGQGMHEAAVFEVVVAMAAAAGASRYAIAMDALDGAPR